MCYDFNESRGAEAPCRMLAIEGNDAGGGASCPGGKYKRERGPSGS
jgi:hypothetical protein